MGLSGGWAQFDAGAGPTAQLSDGVWGVEVQMPGSHLRFVRTLDFDVLDGLGARAAAEIRDTEDALIGFTEASGCGVQETSGPARAM